MRLGTFEERLALWRRADYDLNEWELKELSEEERRILEKAKIEDPLTPDERIAIWKEDIAGIEEHIANQKKLIANPPSYSHSLPFTSRDLENIKQNVVHNQARIDTLQAKINSYMELRRKQQHLGTMTNRELSYECAKWHTDKDANGKPSRFFAFHKPKTAVAAPTNNSRSTLHPTEYLIAGTVATVAAPFYGAWAGYKAIETRQLRNRLLARLEAGTMSREFIIERLLREENTKWLTAIL